MPGDSNFSSYLLLTILFLVALQGCSVMLALKQPEKKNLTVLEPGTPRSTVVKELGSPIKTDEVKGANIDVFQFSEGYSRELKMLRAGLHLTADAFTFGIWELFGIIIEKGIRPPETSLEVHYDADDRLTTFKVLTGENILLASSPAETPPAAVMPSLSPSVTPVLMPQTITSYPQRLAVILPQGPTASFVSSGLDLTLAYLRTFHPPWPLWNVKDWNQSPRN